MRGAALAAALAPLLAPGAESPTFTVRELTPETALKAAQAALASCRASSYQVSVAVVDREGLLRALLRDRYAGPHTIELATNKAWTAATTRTPTSEVEKLTRAGQPMSGLRNASRIAALAGGLPIEAGGSLLGAIGVSGAPGSAADEACAKAGLKAVSDDLEF